MPPPSRSRTSSRSRTGTTSGAAVQVEGLTEFRAELKTLENGPRWVRELGAAQREIAREVAGWARFEAASMGGPQGHFASAIKGVGGVGGARIQIADPKANAAFWGAKQRTGWNAGNEAPNQPDWVGNSWDVAVRGQGPYAINSTLAARQDEIASRFEQAAMQIVANASNYFTETF